MNAIAKSQPDPRATILANIEALQPARDTPEGKRGIQAEVRKLAALTDKQQQSQARRVGRDRGVVDGVDYGPGLRMEREEIDREDRADIADDSAYKRLIRGGRRRDGLRLMHSRGELTDSQLYATEKFRDDLAQASGARLHLPGGMGVHTRHDSAAYHPTMGQIDAHTRVTAAWKRINPDHQAVVAFVVIGWGTIGAFADLKHIRPARATAALLAALDVLADFYTEGNRKVRHTIAGQPQQSA